jgi:hypothetical protein
MLRRTIFNLVDLQNNEGKFLVIWELITIPSDIVCQQQIIVGTFA